MSRKMVNKMNYRGKNCSYSNEIRTDGRENRIGGMKVKNTSKVASESRIKEQRNGRQVKIKC